MTDSFWEKVRLIAVGACGGIAGALGGWDPLLQVLVGCMVVDYVSGIIVALMGKSLKTECGKLSSRAGGIGILKKGLMLFVVLIAALLDQAIGVDGNMFRDAVCWFYVANELLSINENLKLAGVDFPQRLKGFMGEKRRDKDKDQSNQ